MQKVLQVSTLNALMLGDFNGAMTVKDLLSDCDTGIGTYEGLDGEALIVDGVAYKGTADGTVVKMADTDKMAFSTVTKFDHSVKEQTITNVEDIKTLKEKLQPIVDQNKNIFYMFLAHAKFSKMHVRSCYKCAKPYPTLAEAACEQREYHYENEEGQIIAIYCPDYVEGINLPGWHFHFLSDDKTHGGHILGLSADEFTFKMNAIPEFDLDLPTDSDFGKLNLTEDLSESTNAVEGN